MHHEQLREGLRRRGLAVATLLALGVVACGDDDTGAAGGGGSGSTSSTTTSATSTSSSTGTGGSGGEGGGTGGSGGGGGAAIDVLVVDASTGEGVEGVGVVVETLDGDRLEALSDEAGEATVPVDAAEVAAALAHADGRSFHAVSGALVASVVAEGGAVIFYVWSLTPGSGPEPPEPILVSGELLNKAEVDSFALVSATSTNDVFNEAGVTSYELPVGADQAFTLIGMEWQRNSEAPRVVDDTILGWALSDQPASSVDVTADLDFAGDVMASAVTGSIARPVDDRLAEEGILFVGIQADQAFAGYAYSTAPAPADDGYEFSAAWVGAPPATLRTNFSLDVPGVLFTNVFWEGPPTAGEQAVTIVSPPHRTAPEGPGPHPFTEPFEWTLDSTYDPAGGTISIPYSNDESQVGIAQVAAGETSFTMPALPSTSTELAPGPLRALVFLEQAGAGYFATAAETEIEIESPFGD